MYKVVATLTVTAALALTACGDAFYKDDRGKGDAPVDQVEDTEVTVYPNGDGYPNISVICTEKGNGVYSTTREAPPVVVTNDPECEV